MKISTGIFHNNESNDFSEQNFVVLSTTDWDAPQFGSRQQISLELARRGHRVLFVEVPRAVHSLISDPEGTKRALGRSGRFRFIRPNLVAYTPLPVLPVYYHRWTNGINQRWLHGMIRATLRRLGWQPDVLWTYWPNTAYQVRRFKQLGCRTVYHCIDDFTAVTYPFVSSATIARMEADQCRQVDHIFTRTEALTESKKRLNERTYYLPGGVDIAQFDPAQVQAEAKIVQLGHPIIGFVGTFDNRVDVDLLQQAVMALPDYVFIFVGPIKQHVTSNQAIRNRPNVVFWPAQPHTAVPATIAAFDVCLIPYRRNPYTEGLSPIKLYEYLAMGKPVIGTRLPYLAREEAHIWLAETADEFIEAIRQAASQPISADDRNRWRQAAAGYSWQEQVDRVEAILKS
jgi:glycosyltransferase involved in cell wall biosynthesis